MARSRPRFHPFAARGRITPATTAEGRPELRRFLFLAGGFLAGAALALALAVAAAWAFAIPQAEGAYAMGVAFFWMPLCGLIGAVAGLVLARRR